MGHKDSTISNRVGIRLPLLDVLVDINVLVLLNIVLDDLVNRDIEYLNITSTSTRNDRRTEIAA